MYFSILYDQTMLYSCFRFLNINCRFPGSTHDAYVMSNSNIPGIMANLQEGGWLLGNSGYPLKDFLTTPFNIPSTQMEERYNLAQYHSEGIWRAQIQIQACEKISKYHVYIPLDIICNIKKFLSVINLHEELIPD